MKDKQKEKDQKQAHTKKASVATGSKHKAALQAQV
jgi:histone H3